MKAIAREAARSSSLRRNSLSWIENVAQAVGTMVPQRRWAL